MSSSLSSAKKSTTVPLVAPNMFIRIRPTTNVGGHAQDGAKVGKELHGWDDESVTVGWSCSNSTDMGKALEMGKGTKHTYPNRVLQPDITQDDMYNMTVAEPLLNKLMGFTDNAAKVPTEKPTDAMLFAYGQTGTGKTWTTIGPDFSLNSAPRDGSVDPRWGVFPRVVYSIFDRMSKTGRPFTVAMSAVEFYLFASNDLLNLNAPVIVGTDDFMPMGQRQVVLRKPQDVIPILTQARKSRHTRNTKMNIASSDKADEHGGSSRGHACFIISLLQLDPTTQKSVRTCFNLFDLAGAERPDKTGEKRIGPKEAELEMYQIYGAQIKGEKVPQASIAATAYCINWELFCIGESIIKATDINKKNKGAEGYKPKAALSTDAVKVMSGCYGGSCAMSIVITLSQAPQCGWETWFSCKWGSDMSALRSPLRGRAFTTIKSQLEKCKKDIKESKEALAKEAIKNQLFTWKRMATVAHAGSLMVQLRELAMSAPTPIPGLDLESADVFDLPPPVSTGFTPSEEGPCSTRLQSQYELGGKWDQTSLEQFVQEDATSSEEAMTEWFKMPMKTQRDAMDKAMLGLIGDADSLSWVERCPPTEDPLVLAKAAAEREGLSAVDIKKNPPSLTIDTTPFAPCDNNSVKVFVHRPPGSSRGGGGTTTKTETAPVAGAGKHLGDTGAARAAAALIYCHGGGCVAGSAMEYAAHAARYAVQGGGDSGDLVVFNLEYRLAPENKAPAGILDAVGTIHYLYENHATLSIDPARIGIAGDSGGGLIAAGAAYFLAKTGQQDKLKLCLPICPQVSDIFLRGGKLKPEVSRPEGGATGAKVWCSWVEKLLTPGTKTATKAGKNSTSAAAAGGDNNSSSSFDRCFVWPAKMSSAVAKVFPKTAIVTAEYDMCRRMGEDLASVLDKEGKLCDFLVHPGTMHCWHMSMSHPKSDMYWRDLAALLQEHLLQ